MNISRTYQLAAEILARHPDRTVSTRELRTALQAAYPIDDMTEYMTALSKLGKLIADQPKSLVFGYKIEIATKGIHKGKPVRRYLWRHNAAAVMPVMHGSLADNEQLAKLAARVARLERIARLQGWDL